MGSTTTNICVNVTMYYWKLCSVGSRITVARRPAGAHSNASYTGHAHPDTPTHSLTPSPFFKSGSEGPFLLPSMSSLQIEGTCSLGVISGRKEVESERTGLFCRKQTTKHKARQSTFEGGQSSILAHHSPKRKEDAKQLRSL